MAISNIYIVADDPARLAKFYEEAFGLALTPPNRMHPDRWHNETGFSLTQRPSGTSSPGIRMGMRAITADTIESIRAAGGEVLAIPGADHVVVRDPEGNRIVVQEDLEPVEYPPRLLRGMAFRTVPVLVGRREEIRAAAAAAGMSNPRMMTGAYLPRPYYAEAHYLFLDGPPDADLSGIQEQLEPFQYFHPRIYAAHAAKIDTETMARIDRVAYRLDDLVNERSIRAAAAAMAEPKFPRPNKKGGKKR
jgi:predicted enzyme related to lactoylglutathione lyase